MVDSLAISTKLRVLIARGLQFTRYIIVRQLVQFIVIIWKPASSGLKITTMAKINLRRRKKTMNSLAITLVSSNPDISSCIFSFWVPLKSFQQPQVVATTAKAENRVIRAKIAKVVYKAKTSPDRYLVTSNFLKFSVAAQI